VDNISDTSPARLVTALLLALTGAVATIGIAAPASARSVTVTDPVDPPPRGDLRIVTYADRETTAVTTAHVRRLRSTGTLRTRIARPGSKNRYDAVVSATRGGHVTARLVHVTGHARTAVRCDLGATWSARTDTIRVSVPQSCLRYGRFLSQHWFRTTLSVASSSDAAPGRRVGRGGSPGCATAGELRRVTRGQRLGDVHAHLDTAGRFGDGGAGGYSRVYRACQGGKPYWVEYDGRTRRVTGKGRES
jgi:hypothetical protein